MNRKTKNKNLVRLVCVFLLLLIAIPFFNAYSHRVRADELSDINNQIQQKQKEKEQTLKNIKDIEKNIQSIASSNSSLASQLNQLKAQKTNLDKQVSDLNKKNQEQDDLLKKVTTDIDTRQKDIQERTNYMYKLSFSQPDLLLGEEKDAKSFFSDLARASAEIDMFRIQVKDYQNQVQLANQLKTQIDTDKKNAQATIDTVNKQINDVQSKIAGNQNAIAAANKNKQGLVSKSNDLSSQLQGLSARQKQLLDAEIAKMNAAKQAVQKPLENGQYFFMGRGRDRIEGHGIGMSQWGMYGMAQKGWTYDQILKFYYTGVTIGDYQEPDQIVVDGKTNGPIPFQDYLAGIGEVPSSWPEEAVKAQVVAARTYAMRAAHPDANGVMHICGTDACQVYNGGTDKKKYVEATKGKVILYNGAPIVAYYTASARGYTTSLNAAWGSTDLPYIKPVKDDEYAYKDYKSCDPYVTASCNLISTYNWQWRTNGYTLGQLTEIFSKSSSLNVGNVQRVDVSKDVSNRVSKITLVGDKGQKSLTGWDFRAIFNAVTPYNDYVYSTEFAFYQK